ncbi:hypothetical protein [Sporolactobacillus terrae]|uniref:hypothetical protein n=1 Tax=Sporolactobacillus terrae TaxID=269673 RepID=UPI00048B4BD3|nr:hypothetical protein [Sporolactobacillus terrae]
MNVKVLNAFVDKETRKEYSSGSIYPSSDIERIRFLQEKGFLEMDAPAETPTKEKADDKEVDETELPSELKHLGGGVYELPNGEHVKGKKKALEELKNLKE